MEARASQVTACMTIDPPTTAHIRAHIRARTSAQAHKRTRAYVRMLTLPNPLTKTFSRSPPLMASAAAITESGTSAANMEGRADAIEKIARPEEEGGRYVVAPVGVAPHSISDDCNDDGDGDADADADAEDELAAAIGAEALDDASRLRPRGWAAARRAKSLCSALPCHFPPDCPRACACVCCCPCHCLCPSLLHAPCPDGSFGPATATGRTNGALSARSTSRVRLFPTLSKKGVTGELSALDASSHDCGSGSRVHERSATPWRAREPSFSMIGE